MTVKLTEKITGNLHEAGQREWLEANGRRYELACNYYPGAVHDKPRVCRSSRILVSTGRKIRPVCSFRTICTCLQSYLFPEFS